MKLKSTLLLLITASIWGFAFVAQSFGGEHLGPFAFNGIRFFLGALSLVPVIAIFEGMKEDRKVRIKTIIVSAVAGAVLFIASALQQVGIQITNAPGKASFITALYTVLVPVIALVLFKKKASVLSWAGVGVAVVGFYFLCIGKVPFVMTESGFGINPEIAIGIGDLILLVGSVFWALHIIVIDRYGKEIPSLKFACLQFFVCASINVICSVAFESYTVANVTAAGIPILYCGLCSVGIAYTCQILGQKGLDPSTSAIICSTESVFGVIGEALIMKKAMTASGYAGCVLIFAGMILSQLSDTPLFEKMLRNKQVKE